MEHRPAIVFSVFGTSTGCWEVGIYGSEGAHDNAFYGAFFSAAEAREAIDTECSLLSQKGTLFYRFYVYRSWTGERACVDQGDVRALGERQPEGLDAFYVEFCLEEWGLAGRTARRERRDWRV